MQFGEWDDKVYRADCFPWFWWIAMKLGKHDHHELQMLQNEAYFSYVHSQMCYVPLDKMCTRAVF